MVSYLFFFFLASTPLALVSNQRVPAEKEEEEQEETIPVVDVQEEEVEADDYVPDDQLLAAAQLPAPPHLPDIQLLPVEDSLTRPLHGRPKMAFELGRGRHVFIASFNGDHNLHVREMKINELTKSKYPTPQGICLDSVQTRSLIHHLPEMRAAVAAGVSSPEMNWHLGKLVFASFNPDYGMAIDLRKFWVTPEGRLHGTRKGIRLNQGEVDNLAWAMDVAPSRWHTLANYDVPCFITHEQENDVQRAKEDCPYCSPLIGL